MIDAISVRFFETMTEAGEEFGFEIAFYEDLESLDSSDPRVLELLAQLYTKVGRIKDGLSMDLRLSKRKPHDPVVHYNLACSLALTGQSDEAIQMLRQAFTLGYTDVKWMMEDEDLESIRDLPGYESLMDEIGSY